MTPLLSLILLITIAYIGSIFLHNIKTSSSIFKGIINAGIIYLIIGYVIGPLNLKILDTKILENLSIIQAFVLGWAGLLIGIQINAKQMTRFPLQYYYKSILIFLISLIGIAGGMLLLNLLIFRNLSITDILIISIAGSISSPLFIGVLKKEFGIRGKVVHFMQFHSAYDNMLGVLCLGGLLFVRFEITKEIYVIFRDILIVISGTALISLLFYFVSKEIKSIAQYFLLIIGFLLIIVGSAIVIESSIVFVAFLFGVFLANLPINTWKLFQTISNTEKPIYLLLLIFVGARITFTDVNILLFLVFYLVWRTVLKIIVSNIIISRFKEMQPNKKIISWSGIGMGGLTLAIGLDYYGLSDYLSGHEVLLILALSYVLNDSFGLKIIKNKISEK